MTVKSFLPEREMAICQRLREVRIDSRFKQAEFAEFLGITRERLASYEYAKAPVRYEVGIRACHKFNINQRWFATGQRPKNPWLDIAPDLVLELHGRYLFSEAFDRVLASQIQERIKEAEKLVGRDMFESGEFETAVLNNFHAVGESPPAAIAFYANKTIQMYLRWLPDDLLPEYAEALFAAHERFAEKYAAKIRKLIAARLEKSNAERAASLVKPRDSQAMLDASAAIVDSADMQALKSVPDLVARLKRLSKKLGSKAALARKLGVTRQAVDQWLNGKTTPSTDIAIKVMNLGE